jgi:hypothetical protein
MSAMCTDGPCPRTERLRHPGGRTNAFTGTIPNCAECREIRAAEQRAAYKDALGTADYEKYESQIQLRTLSGYNSAANTAILVLRKERDDPKADPARKRDVEWALKILEGTPESF